MVLVISEHLLNFTVGVTDVDPRSVSGGPLTSQFVTCATHGPVGRGLTVALTCEKSRDVRGRYLFVAANVVNSFHLAEVEVFAGESVKCPNMPWTPFRKYLTFWDLVL